jgi:hypothetical protein
MVVNKNGAKNKEQYERLALAECTAKKKQKNKNKKL